MLSQRGLQTIAIHILPNISRSKNNQAMKFGQSIEYNRNIFFKNQTRCGRETISRPFSKESRWSIFLYSLFLLHAKLRVIEIY